MILKWCWENTIIDIQIFKKDRNYNMLNQTCFELFFTILLTPVLLVLDIALFPFELLYYICRKIVVRR